MVTGGTLGQLTQSGSDPKVYTATFTPTNNSTTAGSIGVRAGKFTDLATTPNANVDDYTLTGGANNNAENTNNLVTISVNTTVASGLTLINDTTTAKEAGVQNGGNTAEAGTNPSTTTQSAGVLGNDTAATSVTQIAASGGSNSAVSSGSTGASGGTTVTGQYGTLVMGANGTYTYTLNNSNGNIVSGGDLLLQRGGNVTNSNGRLTSQGLMVSLTLGATGALVLGFLMASYTDATAPWQDAALSAFSLVAQVWMAQKRVECWPLWIVLDLLFVALFLTHGMHLTAGLYALFTLLAISGWLGWRQDPALRGAA